MREYLLNNGVGIPVLGFGTWKAQDGEEAYQATLAALKAGYRHIDTAAIYKNEESVGRAIKDSGIPREELFITTKLWNDIHTYEEAQEAFAASMERLGLDYLDLYLIHWPNPKPLRENDAWKKRNAEVWRAMEDLYNLGKIRAIGVSNFLPHHLEALLETARMTPAVNQIRLAPGVYQTEAINFCREHEILLEACLERKTMTPTYEIDNPNLSYQTKLDLWETGFGLQKVDDLEPSPYMRELAEQNSQGKLTYQEVYDQVTVYHQETDDSTREADLVAMRIVELLSSNAFKFAPTTLKLIHRELFFGLLPHGIPLGEYRSYNITKSEAVLNGDSVIYDDFRTVADSLTYDFQQESQFDYRGKSDIEVVQHIKTFISGIWQIHPFGEGNTRTITVFLIKYLRTMGFQVDNKPFQENAKYFRDALVLDNAKLFQKKTEYLERFFENLLLAGEHDLEIDLRD